MSMSVFASTEVVIKTVLTHSAAFLALVGMGIPWIATNGTVMVRVAGHYNTVDSPK